MILNAEKDKKGENPEGFKPNMQIDRSMKLIKILILVVLGLISMDMVSQPNITVRFANPVFNCTNQNLTVDVEYQCNQSGKQLFGMNVRLFYPDNVLEFINFSGFVTGYSAVSPNPPVVSTYSATSGMTLFGFPGPAEYVNGAIQKTSTTSLTLSTTSWTKIFSINFHVDDVNAFNSSSFCPVLIWDKNEAMTAGFLTGSEGVVMLVVNGTGTGPVNEYVQQFNWTYDGIPGNPHGYPVSTNCFSTICGYAPKSYLPTVEAFAPGATQIPVGVIDFENIGEFSIAFDYDSTILDYSSFTANTIFNDTNGYLTVTNTPVTGTTRRITLGYDGLGITLADSSNLAVLSFISACGSTPLTWSTTGNTCYYANGIDYPLWDEPASTYYFNGEFNLEVVAPLTKIDSTVATAGDLVTFTVRVWNYLNIEEGSLTLDFDPSVLSFYQALPNEAFATGFTSQVIGSGRLELNWSGDTSLADGSHLAYLVFSNIGGVSSLSWFDTGSTCQYISSITLEPLNDLPTCDYYINGNIAPSEFVWTGEVSNDWNENDNWEFGLVPDQFTDVIINTSGARTLYPTFTGNFTLGVQCRNMTMVGSSEFAVTGDFTINPGNTLEMTGASLLHVGGDWTNSGTFIPGNGMVDFTGSSDAAISEGVPPQNYVNAYILSEGVVGMAALTGATAGPSGDDAHSDVSIGFTFNYLGTAYTQVRINTNGWLSLNLSGSDDISSNNILLFETGNPGTVLAPWWDDLNMDGSSSVSYKTTGTAPNRTFTAEWKNMLGFATGSTDRLNFQVKLHESTNVIEFCYGDAVPGTHNSQEGASIGIKDATGGLGNYLEASHNSSNLILPFLNDINNWPEVNYIFTPPVPNDEDIFYKLMVTKTGGEVSVQRDVRVTGIE